MELGELIIEMQEAWGGLPDSNFERLLLDTASHINRLLRSPWLGVIQVVKSERGHPWVEYRDSRTDPINVHLAARGPIMTNYAFEFAHEFGHILTGYEDLEGNSNKWFEEALCELASVFTLRRMGERWPTDPPYSNWWDLAWQFPEYASARMNAPGVQLPPDTTLPDWLAFEEPLLREDPDQRNKSNSVAYALLPLFEERPSGWNTIRALPNSSDELGDYLAEWAAAVHPDDRQFIVDLAEILGYDIDSVAN